MAITAAKVHLREIDDANRDAVVALRVRPGQERFVASVAESIDEAAATPEGNPWYRAIYVGDEPVGFVMLSWDVTPSPGIIGPWFLWRLLIDERFQRRGYGRAALERIVEIVRGEGATELLTSYQPGDGEPWPFYERFGFEPTGDVDGTEIVIRLRYLQTADVRRPTSLRCAGPPRRLRRQAQLRRTGVASVSDPPRRRGSRRPRAAHGRPGPCGPAGRRSTPR